MDIQNKRIPDGEFDRLRQEVLAQWPTGKGVDLEEAVAYPKAMPEDLFSWPPRRRARPWCSPGPACR